MAINLDNIVKEPTSTNTGTTVEPTTGNILQQPTEPNAEINLKSYDGTDIISVKSSDNSIDILYTNIKQVLNAIQESDIDNNKKLATIKSIVDFVNQKIQGNSILSFNTKSSFDLYLSSSPTVTNYVFVTDSAPFSFTDSSGGSYTNVEWMELIVIVDNSVVTTKVTSTNQTSILTEQAIVTAMSSSTTDYFVNATEKSKIGNLPSNTTSDITNLTNNKVDKVAGKGLSTEDYTTTEKNKVSNIPSDTNSSLTTLTSDVASKLNKEYPEIKGSLASLTGSDHMDIILIYKAINNDVPVGYAFQKSGSNYYALIKGSPNDETLDFYIGSSTNMSALDKIFTIKSNGVTSEKGYFTGTNSKIRYYKGAHSNDGSVSMDIGRIISGDFAGIKIKETWDSTASKNNHFVEIHVNNNGTTKKLATFQNDSLTVDGTIQGNSVISNGALLGSDALSYTDTISLTLAEKELNFIVKNWNKNIITFCGAGANSFTTFPAITENGSDTEFKVGDSFIIQNMNSSNNITLNLSNKYWVNSHVGTINDAGNFSLASTKGYQFVASIYGGLFVWLIREF